MYEVHNNQRKWYYFWGWRFSASCVISEATMRSKCLRPPAKLQITITPWEAWH